MAPRRAAVLERQDIYSAPPARTGKRRHTDWQVNPEHSRRGVALPPFEYMTPEWTEIDELMKRRAGHDVMRSDREPRGSLPETSRSSAGRGARIHRRRFQQLGTNCSSRHGGRHRWAWRAARRPRGGFSLLELHQLSRRCSCFMEAKGMEAADLDTIALTGYLRRALTGSFFAMSISLWHEMIARLMREDVPSNSTRRSRVVSRVSRPTSATTLGSRTEAVYGGEFGWITLLTWSPRSPSGDTGAAGGVSCCLGVRLAGEGSTATRPGLHWAWSRAHDAANRRSGTTENRAGGSHGDSSTRGFREPFRASSGNESRSWRDRSVRCALASGV